MGLERLVPELLIAGKWRLRRRIGRGGMGEVWLAVHTSLDQEVAVKVLDADAFGHDLLDEARSRFHLEAQVAAELSRRTRHIAQVIDHGEDSRGTRLDYLVMELLVGESLEEVLQRDGRSEPGRVAEIMRQAARGLNVAHADNVVHRDLKPSNVFLTKDDEGGLLVKLLDFGIAKANARISHEKPQTHRTRAGVLLGTAAYMSPEQARGLEIDKRVDLWALACVAYELLTGAMPFIAENELDLLMKICTTQPAPPSSIVATLSPAVDAVFARAFAAEIDERFPDAREFAHALVAAVGPVPSSGVDSVVNVTYEPTPLAETIARPQRRPILVAVTVAALLVVVAVLAFSRRAADRTPAAAAHATSEPNVSAPNVSAPNVSASNISASNVSASNVSASNVSASNVSASKGEELPKVPAPRVSPRRPATPSKQPTTPGPPTAPPAEIDKGEIL